MKNKLNLDANNAGIIVVGSFLFLRPFTIGITVSILFIIGLIFKVFKDDPWESQ